MEKQNIMAVWQTCKSLLKQAETYKNAGFTSVVDQTGASKMSPVANPNQRTTDCIPKDILNSISEQFDKVIEFIQLYLIQNNGASFYGLIMMDIDVGIDYNQNGLLDVKIKTKPMTLTYNPFYIQEYTLNELIGSTIDEIMKIVYLHPASFSNLNPGKDPKVHDDLEAASSVASTELVMNDMRLEGTNNRIRINEDVYTKADLEEEIAEDTRNRKLQPSQGLEYYYKVASTYRKNQPHAGGGGSNMDMPGNSDTHQWEDCDSEETSEEIKSMIKNAYDNLNAQARGLLPSSLVQHIDQLFKEPEIDWHKELRHYLGIIPAGHRPTPLRLNRKQPDRFDLCGRLTDKTARLVVAIDTSGSMSATDIEYCMNEVFDIIKCSKTKVTIIECDAAIGRIYEAKKPSDIKPNVSGRGGTSFVPVIEYLNSHKFKDAVLIYFTDGYGDYEIPKPRTYRNLWVVLRDAKCLSLKEPYGRVTSLQNDEKYKKSR